MAAQNSNQLWNPYTILELHPLGGKFSCVGSAITRGNSQCRWPIDPTMQYQARQKLNAMAVEHPSSRAVTNALWELVPILLCKEVHREIMDQRHTKFSEWRAKVQDVAVELKVKGEMVSEMEHLKADLARYQEAQRQLENKVITLQARIMKLEADLAGKWNCN